MSLLDDINRQAEQKRQQLESGNQFSSQLEKTYVLHINPRLKAFYSYFNKLTENLNFINQHASCTYDIPGAGNIDGFVQGKYHIVADNSDHMKEIKIKYHCDRNKPFDFIITSNDEAKQVRDNLYRLNVSFEHKPNYKKHGNTGTLFILSGKIPVQIRLYLEPDSINITLESINLPRLGVFSKRLRPDEINEDFMENVGHFLLRKSSNIEMKETVVELITGDRIEDDPDEKLRKELKKQLRKKARDPAFAQENKAPKPGFFKRLFTRNQ